MRWHSYLGPGPVFAYEWLTTTRRWQFYAVRAGFTGIILLGMMLTWSSRPHARLGQTVSIQILAQYGQALYGVIAALELSLVLLVAPALTAGAVCVDKARGTLDHIFATDLSNAEIILGKLAVRLVPALGLIACVLPVAALGGLFGGIDPLALAGSFLTATGCAVLGCSLALMLSVWGRKTHEVLMMTYLLLVVWLISPGLTFIVAFFLPSTVSTTLAQPLVEWLSNWNPYHLAVAPYTRPGNTGVEMYLLFLGACLFLSLGLVGLATARIRSVALRQASPPTQRPSRQPITLLQRSGWLPYLTRPSLDGNPVFWREWRRTQPSWFLRVVWFVYSALGVLWTGLTLVVISKAHVELEVVSAMNLFQVTLGLLLVSVSAATSLAEERVRGSLDILLSTPLSTRSILAGKWLGSFRQVAHVVVWPAMTTGLLVAQSGKLISYFLFLMLISAYGAVITSVGLAIATWVSRLERAVAICVSTYIAFSVGWLIAVAIFASHVAPGAGLVMASPLYGTVLGTLAVLRRERPLVVSEAGWIAAGELVWSFVGYGFAAILFTVTEATFDRYLGRISETGRRPILTFHKKTQPETGLDISDWLSETPTESSDPPTQWH